MAISRPDVVTDAISVAATLTYEGAGRVGTYTYDALNRVTGISIRSRFDQEHPAAGMG
jgi:hypothetical protein